MSPTRRIKYITVPPGTPLPPDEARSTYQTAHNGSLPEALLPPPPPAAVEHPHPHLAPTQPIVYYMPPPTASQQRGGGCAGMLFHMMLLGLLMVGSGVLWYRWQPILSVPDLAVVREHLAGSMDTQVFSVTGHASAPPAAPALDLTAVAPIGDLPSPPSITAAQIDAVLESYGSPAVGTGAIFYDQGVAHGIDPAYALAFFVHESSAGTNPGWAGLKPDGSTTHNIGNIICAGYPTCFGRFRDYPSWEVGIADWYRLIRDEYMKEEEEGGRGLTTVEEIIPVYAPVEENNVPDYIQTVEKLVTTWRAEAATVAADLATTPATLPPLQIQDATFQPETGEVTGWLQNDTDAVLVLPAGSISFVIGEEPYRFDTPVELAPHQRQAFAIAMPVTITADQPRPTIRMEVTYDRGVEIVEVSPTGGEG